MGRSDDCVSGTWLAGQIGSGEEACQKINQSFEVFQGESA